MATIPSGNSTPRGPESLLMAALAGSNDALGTLMQSCRTYLLVVGERELGNDLQVKISPSDLVQETFAEGRRSLASFSGETPEEFYAWMRGILLNKLAHARRRYLATASRSLHREERQPNHSSITAQAELIVDDDTPSKLAIRKETAQLVIAALDRLPDHYRAVIQLRNFDLLPFSEIARVMQRSEHELRALWVRAMQRLKRELDGTEAH